MITGNSGFIGFSLTLRLLKQGYKVLGYDSLNNYYDINLKKNGSKIIDKTINTSFI